MIDTEDPSSDAAKLETMAQEAEADPAGQGKQPELPGVPPGDATRSNVTPIEGKRGRGRPPGSRTKNRASLRASPELRSDASATVTPELMRAAIQIPYALAARRLGEHWIMSDEEADRLVPVHLAVAEQYLPAVIKKHASLYTIALVHLMAVSARAAITLRLKAEADREARELATAPPAPGPERIVNRTSDTAAVPPAAEVYKSRVRPGPKEKPAGD